MAGVWGATCRQATVCRLVLGDRLGRQRRSLGLTLREVAGALYASSAKLCRIESGRHRPAPADVERLADFYQVDAGVREQWLQWAQVAQGRGAYHAFADVADAMLRDYLDVEAAGLRAVYGPVVIPAVLRTRGYARALYGGMSEPEAQRRLWLLALRQRRFAEEGPKPVQVLLGEAAVNGGVGGAQVMEEQRDRLRRAGEMGVKVRVLPHERVVPDPQAHCGFAVAALDAGRCVLCGHERLDGRLWLVPDRGRYAAARFARLWQAALGPDLRPAA
ncbi:MULTISPECIES: Scr1 family TA system antitoxin-like transcriptional regulator [Streptomyces]|uniref:Scr1 family TA system antitoxin-like transcriptional regulator n=1 Tax=Streptomyces TaxID=1883 RepID=UPI0004CDB6B2|nr:MULTISPECIES: Scr1 family TA system antitoxin-like transcriptional regulator [Streptomyces]KOT64387.1 hypothetical protein ADK43_06080 [Streptomyces rimosus subsp. rimosus]